MKRIIAFLLLINCTSIQASLFDTCFLDVGLGLHNKSSADDTDGYVKRYPSIDYAENPIFIADISCNITEKVYAGILHNSSVISVDSNYGFNLIYIKRRFNLF